MDQGMEGKIKENQGWGFIPHPKRWSYAETEPAPSFRVNF
jgi:hypothetical protein